jgi:hypothetical protein
VQALEFFATVATLPTPDPANRFKMGVPLDVQPPGDGAAYRVDCVFPAARPVDLLKVGTTLPVKVDPDNRQHVAVIWNLWLADHGRHLRRGAAAPGCSGGLTPSPDRE